MDLWEQIMRESNGRRILPGRNELPEILYDAHAAGRFDGDGCQLAVATDDAWSMCEFPLRMLDLDDWCHLLGEVGFIDNGQIANVPAQIPTLYRAAAEGYEIGMSWTDNPETALFFYDRNERFGFRTTLLRLDPLTGMDRYQVAMRCHGKDSRDESEWVIDTRYLEAVPTAIVPDVLRAAS